MISNEYDGTKNGLLYVSGQAPGNRSSQIGQFWSYNSKIKL